ncbi:MAG: SusD/RagB family nutrient-binding outer membrane lipoprotein [Cyclobacteriaceae bacterium]
MKIFLLTMTVLVMAGCTEDFEEINSNPNEPEVVTPNLLLPTVISNTMNQVVDFAWDNGNIVAQLTAKINFTDFDRYNWSSESGRWNSLYGNLTEVEAILTYARAEETANSSYEGIALVLKSWMYSILTDNWGDIPYEEAISLETQGISTPVYNSQQEIYAGILADLATADDLLTLGTPIIGGDVLYSGDLTKWRKLANSLRMRYLMRSSNVMDVSGQMQQIVSSELLFESNADNAVLTYPASSQVDSWPISNGRIGGFDEHRMSTTSESILKGFNDNRMFSWFQPTDNPDDDPSLFVGLPNGLSENNASTFNGGASNVSRLNQSFFYDSPNSVEAPLMQYAELQFILAEAAQRGLISGDARAYYEAGIQASFDFWNTDQDMDAYMTQTGVAYDGELETIMTQKWLASFLVSAEAWYDYRRTGLPSFIIPGQDNVNSDRVPVRFFYPDSEQTLNAENYDRAIGAMGGEDNLNAKGWWESN